MPLSVIDVVTVLHGHNFQQVCAALGAPFGECALCVSKRWPNQGLFVAGSLDVSKESPGNFITCLGAMFWLRQATQLFIQVL